MPSNDFLPFATALGAPVLSQADWVAATPINGRGAGILPKEYFNKAIRQPSVVSAMLGQFMATHGQNALDNGDLSGLEAAFEAALVAWLNAKLVLTGTTNGTLTLPGGVVLQWGQVHIGNIPALPWTTTTIPFNAAYTAQCFFFGFTFVDLNGNQVAVAYQASKLPSLVDSQVMCGEFGPSTQDIYINWFAIGV